MNASIGVPGRILITGANGHLGQRLVLQLAQTHGVLALVRSADAAIYLAQQLRRGGVNEDNIELRVIDYADAQALAKVAIGCSHAVHLVGIIKEQRANSYAQAHEHTTAALIAAADACTMQGILYLSILGAAPNAANACLASKGRAEALLAKARTPSLVLRLPMVLGEQDFAATALRRQALASFGFVLRGGSKEQPIYAGDVVNACANVCADQLPDASHTNWQGHRTFDLAGPVSLSRKQLIRAAAEVLHESAQGAHPSPRLFDLPLSLGMIGAALLERLLPNPPVTRAMLGVLDHDDDIDPAPACAALGITLTPLPEMLRRVLRADVAAGATQE